MTNVDYRILAFSLAERLQSVIPKIVSTDQTAYIRRRYMGTNIRLVNDVINYFKNVNAESTLLMLDFKKAFDSIEWNFLEQTLKYFNFGPSFMKWIKTLYTLPAACIKNNGYLSETFSIERSVRQGCPVSALLFVLCVEIFAIKVRNNEELAGFTFGNINKHIKISQYADDMILFVNDGNEICTSLNILSTFGDMSGLVLNIPKCESFSLGTHHHNNGFGFKWIRQFRCLGLYLGNDNEANNVKNFEDKLVSIERSLNSWKNRDLTIIGKIQF